MIVKQRLLIVCTISIIFLLIVQHCDAARTSSGSRKTSSGRGSTSGRRTSTGKSGNSGSSGSWWSRVTGGGSSSSSSKVSSSAPQKKPVPSAPRYEEKKHIGWNVQGGNNNPGHQTIQSNNNQYQDLSYPRHSAQQSAGYPVQSNTGGGSSSSSSKVSSSATQTKPEPSAPRYDEKKHIGWNEQGVNNNPGHQTIQSNNNQYQDLSYPRHTAQQSASYPVQSNTGGGSSSSSSKVSSSATQKKPEPSAPRYEEKKPVGWNVQGVNNNPGAPPPYSNTHINGLSNPSLQDAPLYSKNSPPGHQTIQSNNNQYQSLNYPRNTAQQSAGYPVQSNVQSQYPGINYPKNTGQQQSGYYGSANQAGHNSNQGGHYSNQGGHYSNQGGHYPNQGGYYPNQGGYHPNQGGHYSGMNYGGGAYPGYSGYSPAAPNGYFVSGYPVGIISGINGRSGSGSSLTNTLLAGNIGLGLYNAIRPYPSYSHRNYRRYGGGAGGGSTIHNHYYNNQAPGTNPNSAQAPVQAPAQATPSMPDQPGIPLANNNSADPTNALVTPPLPTPAPNEKITDLDCVYAMKILNCSEISQCPQEWLHPSCLNRTISKEYFDSITLPPPPPMSEANVDQTPLAPMPGQAGIPLANNHSADPTNALVTPPPPTLAPNDKITDLDCVYAMKILNCSEIPQCPQEWLHPSCLNRTIPKEYFDSITLPPPPMPEASQNPPEKLVDQRDMIDLRQNKNEVPNSTVYSANSQQMPIVSSSSSSSRESATGCSLCFVIFFGMAALKSALQLKF